MHKNNGHRFAHQLIEKYHESDTSLCIVVKDSKEAKLINNELSLYLNSKNINYFPENEILPYDHFSAPDNILSDRFSILNSLDKEKKIIITTIKSLFELYPTKDFFKSKETFNLGDSLSLNKLEKILISLNYEKVNRIEGINQYSLRGGIIDIYTPIYRNPLRIEIFDDSVESVRCFELETPVASNMVISDMSGRSFNKPVIFNPWARLWEFIDFFPVLPFNRPFPNHCFVGVRLAGKGNNRCIRPGNGCFEKI